MNATKTTPGTRPPRGGPTEPPAGLVRVAPAIFRRRSECRGVDWGGDIRVLVRIGDKELWQVPRGGYRNRMGWVSVAGYLALINQADDYFLGRGGFGKSGGCTKIAEPGRASRAVLWAAREKIDEFFGVPGLAASLSRDWTVTAPAAPESV